MKNKLGIGQTCGLHLLVHKFWSINFGPYFKYAHITFLFLNFPWHIWVEVKSTIPLTHQLMHRLTHCQHFERVSQHTTGTSTETLPKHWLTHCQHFERVSQHTTGTSTETLPMHWLTQHQHLPTWMLRHLIHYKDNEWPTHWLTVNQLSNDGHICQCFGQRLNGMGALPSPIPD